MAGKLKMAWVTGCLVKRCEKRRARRHSLTKKQPAFNNIQDANMQHLKLQEHFPKLTLNQRLGTLYNQHQLTLGIDQAASSWRGPEQTSAHHWACGSQVTIPVKQQSLVHEPEADPLLWPPLAQNEETLVKSRLLPWWLLRGMASLPEHVHSLEQVNLRYESFKVKICHIWLGDCMNLDVAGWPCNQASSTIPNPVR